MRADLAFADDERLAVVGAAVAGGGVGVLQFAVEEMRRERCVRRRFLWRRSSAASRRRSRRTKRRNFRAERGVPGIRYCLSPMSPPLATWMADDKLASIMCSERSCCDEIVGQRARHGVLQHHLVGLQTVPVDGLDL